MRFIALLTLILFLTACDAPQEAAPQEEIRPVKLFPVTDQRDKMIRTFPGVVEANQGAFLAFRVNGEITEFPVLAGEDVKKGQLLAKLDPEDFILQVEDRKARYELAKSQLERTASLTEKGIASEAEFDQARSNAQVAEAALKKAQTDLHYSELRAPFDGAIARVFVKNFESVQAKQNILRLETRDLMDVTIQVPEKLVARVHKDTGYKPTVVFDGFPELAYELTFKEWDTTADERTLTYRVVFTLPIPEEFNLLAGMTGNVIVDMSKITTAQNDHISLPVEAVFADPVDGQSFVWQYNAESGRVNKVAVQVGDLVGDKIIVTAGIEAGDIVVAAGVHYLREGMQVRAYQRERGL